MKNIERRYTLSDLEVRRTNGKKPRLEGYAVRYGTLSQDMGFRELIEPGAFSKNLRSDPDVRALVEHDASKIIGRTTSGTLSLFDDDTGIRVSIDPPDNQTGNDLLESVRRGDLNGMSFGFRSLNDSWGTRDGESLRTISEAELFDVSVTAFPTYPDTTIAVRSMNRWKESTMPKPEETTTVKTPERPSTPQPEVETAPPAPERRSTPATPAGQTPKRGPIEWRDSQGRECRVLLPEQKFVDLHKECEPLSLGRAVRAMITGSWVGAEAEHRALSTTANPTAGVLVPNPLAASVIDKARAMSVLIQAGAKTVNMETGTLKIARVASDATVEVHSENTSFTGSDVVFDGVELTAYTLGILVKMSRELAADAPNSVALIEDVIARALAEKIDWYGLQGTGSGQPLGLTNFGSTNTTAVGGTVDYDNLLDGLKENEVDNHVGSNAYVMSPTNASVLRKLNDGNSRYLGPPPPLDGLKALATSNMPDGTMVIGDFTKYLIGLRQSPVIEVSTEAGSSFEEHGVYIKATWRGAFNTEHHDGFCLLTGIA